MQVQCSEFVANSLTAKRSTKSQQSPQQSSQQPQHPERMVRRSPALLVLLALLSVLAATAQQHTHTSSFGMLLSEDDIIAKEIQWAKNRARMHQQGFKINPTFDFDVENEAVFTMPTHQPYKSTVQSAGSHFVANNLRGSKAFP